MRTLVLLVAGWALAGTVNAADVEAGRERSAACQSCHGPEGISLGKAWPNLAGQKAAYLEAQLEAFRDGTRKNPLMSAMAAQLSDADIDNLAAFFSSLPAGGSGGMASVPAHLTGAGVDFPTGYADSFVQYDTFNRKNGKQVMVVFANEPAFNGMKADGRPGDGGILVGEIYKIERDDTGKPIAGDNGVWKQGPLAAIAVMEKRAGWGDATPADLRNGDWKYAIFKADQTPRPGLNEAPCLACHKPLADEDYMFTYKALAKAAR